MQVFFNKKLIRIFNCLQSTVLCEPKVSDELVEARHRKTCIIIVTDGVPTKPAGEVLIQMQELIVEINSHVALFRDKLILVGQSRDCPELREKIRKLRRICVDTCKHTGQIILPQVKSAMEDGMLAENPNLVLLFYLVQLFLRELLKSYRLVRVVPMDMSGYYENRAGPSNLGNVMSQILLCKQITPDFNQEELCSIAKDSHEIGMLLTELQEYMPQNEPYLERNAAMDSDVLRPFKQERNYTHKNISLLCCVSRPSYL